MFKNINLSSSIINDKKDIYFIEERLKKNEPWKNITYKLLYIATTDGNSAEIFHQKCDNIKGTLVVIKTTKDIIFGGYT